MWWRKKQPREQQLTIYPCPKCNHKIKAPGWFIDQFKPGGKEYHIDGQSHLNCPNCGEMIEIK